VASEAEIKQRFSQLDAWLDERARRLWAAAESVAHGRGGISLVARASGVSRRAIAVGLAELQKKPERSQRKRLPIRQKGGGRKKASLKDPDLLLDLERLLEPVTRGDPQSPLRWTCKSVRNLADELRAQGHKVSHMLVAELLHEQKYSLQANRKTKEDSSHPDRNAQFEYINARAKEFLKGGQPAISVDTKKGSERESVSPPGFIGFPRFGADGLTRLHNPGSESSPMFTDLPARSCIDRRGRRKSPVFRLCRQPRWSDTSANASAGTSSARQFNRMVRWLARGAQGRPSRPQDTVK
jgi:transposase